MRGRRLALHSAPSIGGSVRAKQWWHTLSCPSVERTPIGLSQDREAH